MKVISTCAWFTIFSIITVKYDFRQYFHHLPWHQVLLLFFHFNIHSRHDMHIRLSKIIWQQHSYNVRLHKVEWLRSHTWLVSRSLQEQVTHLEAADLTFHHLSTQTALDPDLVTHLPTQFSIPSSDSVLCAHPVQRLLLLEVVFSVQGLMSVLEDILDVQTRNLRAYLLSASSEAWP